MYRWHEANHWFDAKRVQNVVEVKASRLKMKIDEQIVKWFAAGYIVGEFYYARWGFSLAPTRKQNRGLRSDSNLHSEAHRGHQGRISFFYFLKFNFIGHRLEDNAPPVSVYAVTHRSLMTVNIWTIAVIRESKQYSNNFCVSAAGQPAVLAGQR